MNGYALAGLAIVVLWGLGLAAFGFWNRSRDRLDGWWHYQSGGKWTPDAWHNACEQSLAGSRRRRGTEKENG